MTSAPPPTQRAAGAGSAADRADKGLALEVVGLSKAFGGVQAVRNVSFEVPTGSVVALIGPNGAGKSTTFNLVTNFYSPDAGVVRVWGRDVTRWPPHRIAKAGLFRTFQTSRVFAGMSVLDNVCVGAYCQGCGGYWRQALRWRGTRREERGVVARAMAVLEVVGLADRARDQAETLPLASQKHLDIARALLSGCDLLLFDEPGAGMNDAETAELGELLAAVRGLGKTILIVDHNMSLVMGISEQVTVMDAGQVIASGTPDEVQRDPVVVDAYFGSTEATA
jgi:branched-chain amino acid transport system ATP-binding protein